MKNELDANENRSLIINKPDDDIEYDVEPIPELLQGNVSSMDMQGLTVCTAAVFIVGEIAGGGVVALPNAMNGTGLIGIVLMTAVCVASIYTGTVLGKAWLLVQQRYPEYREEGRCPYPAIGYVTYGNKGRLLVSISINISLYGATVVFMIMAAQNTHDLLHKYTGINFCIWLVIVAAVLIPITWLGTPKDFWFLAVIAMAATVVACIILLADMILDIPNHTTTRHDEPTFESFAMAFGTMLFAFGGHPAFPTFQTDMKVQRKFGYAVGIAYSCVLVIYLAISVSGYIIYGNSTGENVLLAMRAGPLLTIVEALITCHLLFAYIIVINPVCQEAEQLLKIPIHFTWKRMLCRTVLVSIGLFIAETIPKFGALLSLVGASTTNLLAYFLPMFFYEKLCNMEGDWPTEYIPIHARVLNYEIMIVGVLGGVASTYAAIVAIVQPDSLSIPCFVNSSIVNL